MGRGVSVDEVANLGHRPHRHHSGATDTPVVSDSLLCVRYHPVVGAQVVPVHLRIRGPGSTDEAATVVETSVPG